MVCVCFCVYVHVCVCRLPNRPVINTAIVTTTLHREEAGPPGPLGPPAPLTLLFSLLETQERSKPVCVSWDHSLP